MRFNQQEQNTNYQFEQINITTTKSGWLPNYIDYLHLFKTTFIFIRDTFTITEAVNVLLNIGVFFLILCIIRLIGCVLYKIRRNHNIHAKYSKVINETAAAAMRQKDTMNAADADDDHLEYIDPENPRRGKRIKRFGETPFRKMIVAELNADLGQLDWTKANEAVVMKHSASLMERKDMRKAHIGLHVKMITLMYFTPSRHEIGCARATENEDLNLRLQAYRGNSKSFLSYLFGGASQERYLRDS